jgi:transcriptional regulator with XRE-family HTH domain
MPDRETLLAGVGENLVAIRARLGLDVEEAARAAGIEPERLAEAEAGETALDERELGALAEHYGCEVTAFFGGRITPLSYLFGA